MNLETAQRCGRFLLRIAAVAFLFGGMSIASAAADDASDIRTLLAQTWDKPDNRLVVDPVVIVDGSALASWTQGDRGGRALLRRNDGGKWKVVLCSGEPLRHASTLIATGIADADAKALADRLNEAESKLPAERARLFSTFEGVVHVAEDDHHGHSAPADKHSGQHHSH
ncbi:copper uptake system-associated protein [Hyphomicrobium sp. D-2]|uniref:copper uptake system-associated protein n=1 Tax=Hyphomicrobium sp. D-2 TaxID=3041621 RepID=UPI002455D8B8|nr:copper uptake system-associated protein [Hyphomicrobium sp. D-2]MDH4981129.1 copper uptake system-associated protein [Hyphomicrobium sp. D-2]